MKNKLTNPIVITIIFLLGLFGFNYFKPELIDYLKDQGFEFAKRKHLVTIIFNTFYTLISFYFIKKYKLIDLAGLGKRFKLKNWLLLIFPLYIALINYTSLEDIPYNTISGLDYILFFLWALSVGFSEEFMLRGFIQSLFLKHYGFSKKGIYYSVIGAALIFGLLHLLKFDKGLYGEITQVLFATFIGTMFGAILLRTNKLWPLILIHAIIDIFGNLDIFKTANEVSEELTIEAELTNSIVITLVVLPCFIYGLILLRKVKVEQVVSKISE
ncbi:CPBP family intramembrane glutamic endopeptidase [Winogradskyella ursingii]|uniref:CPBP family intramembrane glutamic endopeptidase n=1 Tax=Winogradskyella ursingii TaxID=2686079 RepID=UPI0015C99907|nr:CPBP family intramembrane glutamic endopeptidase [Winogradskyella ursingii]